MKKIKQNTKIEELRLKKDQARLALLTGDKKKLKEYRNLKGDLARALTSERQEQK